MSLGDRLAALRRATAALRAAFPGATDLSSGESVDQIGIERRVSVDRLHKALPSLAPALLEVGFTITLSLKIQGGAWDLEIKEGASGGLAATVRVVEQGPPLQLTEEALAAVTNLIAALPKDAVVGLPSFLSLVGAVAAQEISVDLLLLLFLNKLDVIIDIKVLSGSGDDAHLLCFLFPERLVELLAELSLASLEKSYFEHHKRTVIVLPAMDGGATGELLALWGGDREAEITAALAPLPVETIGRTEAALDFRNEYCRWTQPTVWLIPETLSLTWQLGPAPAADALRQRLQSLRSLLAILFLAERTPEQDGSFAVKWSGPERSPLRFERKDLEAYEPEKSDPLFRLYRFAYDGGSSDKLEVVRRTIALASADLPSLFERADQVREAADKTHQRSLAKRVAEYFEARRKVQDYVQAVVFETESATLKLTDGVAENTYKTVGVIAAAAVASLVKPQITPVAAFLASLVLTIYLGLIGFFSLPSLDETWEIRKRQYDDHVRSFQDVLGEQETQELLENDQVRHARDLFERKEDRARAIYGALFIVALLAALYFLDRLR